MVFITIRFISEQQKNESSAGLSKIEIYLSVKFTFLCSIKVKRDNLCSVCLGLIFHFQDHRRPRMAALAPAIIKAFLLSMKKRKSRMLYFLNDIASRLSLCICSIPVCGSTWNRSQISRLLFSFSQQCVCYPWHCHQIFPFEGRHSDLCFSPSFVFVSRRWILLMDAWIKKGGHFSSTCRVLFDS